MPQIDGTITGNFFIAVMIYKKKVFSLIERFLVMSIGHHFFLNQMFC